MSITVKEVTVTGGGSRTSIVGRDQITVINPPSNGERTWIPALKEALNPAERGDYVVPGCMEGTRESVFKEVDDWLAETAVDSPNIMWISGNPGVGKSAIASSLISRLTAQFRLGAYFFFKRGHANLEDPTALWRTISFDLAHFHSSIRSSIVEFLSRPAFRDSDILLHFECMIRNILVTNHDQLRHAPPVIVIDALDECGSGESQSKQRRIMLDTLNRWPALPRSFKLIVTSRNDLVPSSFRNIRTCRKIALETGDAVGPETRKDIRVFLEKSIADIRPPLGLPPTWPEEADIDELARRAGGLFLWAKTAVAFLEERGGSTKSKLKLALSGNLGKKSESIDSLYRDILLYAFRNSDDASIDLFKRAVGAIILAKEPLHRDDLQHFLCCLEHWDDEHDWRLSGILNNLSSVIEADTVIRLRHLSFADFLCDPDRCREHRFAIDLDAQRRNVTLACLRVLNSGLRFNICGLGSSHLRNIDVKDLPARITDSIPNPLRYACLFWATHLAAHLADIRHVAYVVFVDVIWVELRDFLYNRFLYWLEVMSLVNKVQASSVALLTVAPYLDSRDTDLFNFANDAYKFISSFYTPISESAPHIYISALPFAPENSLISRYFLSRFSKTLSVGIGRDTDWHAIFNVFTPHTDSVFSVTYSPDGLLLVSGSADNSILVLDAGTGKIVAGPFDGHRGPVRSVVFSPDGKRIASGSEDQTLCVWDAATTAVICGPLRGHTAPVLSVGYSPDGKRVVSGSRDTTVRVWEVETGKPMSNPFKGHRSWVTSVAYSPDGKRIASGSQDMTVFVWDAGTGEMIRSWTGGTQINSVAWSPNGKQLVSGSKDGSIHISDAETGDVVARPDCGCTEPVHCVAYSPDGTRVASSSSDRTIKILNVKTGGLVVNLVGHADEVFSVAYSPDGKRIVSSSKDETICLWDVETGPVRSATQGYLLRTGGPAVNGVTYNTPITHAHGTRFSGFNVAAGKITPGPFKAHSRGVPSVAYSRSGRRVVSGSFDKMVRVWDVSTGSIAAGPLDGHQSLVWSVAYSPDETQVASASSDETIRVWDLFTGTAVHCLRGHTGAVLSISYSPDGKNLVSGSEDATIRVWDIETAKTIATLSDGHTDSVLSVSYSPDGGLVASCSKDKTICIWDAKKRQICAGPFKGHSDWVQAVAFSPNGKRVVSGSNDATVRVWDIGTGEIVSGPFQGHENAVCSVAYSPNGKQVVSGSDDTTIRVWDAETGQIVAGPFEGHTMAVWSVAYSPDGQQVVSGSKDTTVCVWNVEYGQLVHADPLSPVSRGSDIVPHFSSRTDFIIPAPNSRHLVVLDAIGGPNVFGTCRRGNSGGWVYYWPSTQSMPVLLFWVPFRARRGLCDAHTVLVLGGRRTQVDLSEFVHGTDWALCHHPDFRTPMLAPLTDDEPPLKNWIRSFKRWLLKKRD